MPPHTPLLTESNISIDIVKIWSRNTKETTNIANGRPLTWQSHVRCREVSTKTWHQMLEMVTLKLIHTVQPIKTVWVISCSKIYDCNHWFIQFIELFHYSKKTDVLYERVGHCLEVANFLKKPSSPAWFSDFVSWVVVMVDWNKKSQYSGDASEQT